MSSIVFGALEVLVSHIVVHVLIFFGSFSVLLQQLIRVLIKP